jgi:hypothetical protein
MTDLDQIFPYVLMAVGIVGFELAGRRVWWAWYVNIANQGLWLAFALITGYWGFVVGTIFYTYQFSLNAYRWSKDRHTLNKPPDIYRPMGRVEEISVHYQRPAEIRIGSIGLYEANCPRVGTIAYYKQGA